MMMMILVSAAIGTQNVHGVGEEAAADERRSTLVAHEALIVPVAVLERDILGTADSILHAARWYIGIYSDWFVASEAFLGEKLAEAVRTVGVVVAGRESLAGERLLTVGACEALAVVGRVLVAHAALRDHLDALVALGRVRLLVARHAKDLVVFRYEALGADRRRAREAQETVLVELLTFVLHFFHAGLEYLCTFVAS